MGISRWGCGFQSKAISRWRPWSKNSWMDAEGSDKLFRYMASIQEFFDQGRHLEIAFD